MPANPGDVDTLLLNTARQNGNGVRIGFGQDPGQTGKSQALHLVRALSGLYAPLSRRDVTPVQWPQLYALDSCS